MAGPCVPRSCQQFCVFTCATGLEGSLAGSGVQVCNHNCSGSEDRWVFVCFHWSAACLHPQTEDSLVQNTCLINTTSIAEKNECFPESLPLHRIGSEVAQPLEHLLVLPRVPKFSSQLKMAAQNHLQLRSQGICPLLASGCLSCHLNWLLFGNGFLFESDKLFRLRYLSVLCQK